MDAAERIGPLGLPDELRVAPPDSPPDEDPLVQAASAVARGEAKAATSALAVAPPGLLADALRVAAHALDTNWHPGDSGAIVLPGDVVAGADPAAPPDAADARVVLRFGRMVPMGLSCRSIADGLAGGGDPAVAATIRTWVDELAATAASLGDELARAWCALTLADVLHRAGAEGASDAWTDAFGRYQASGDLVGVGRCRLLAADWAACRRTTADTLDFELVGELTPQHACDVAAARLHLDEARRAFAAAGATRGLAAVARRDGWLAGRDGDGATWLSSLDEAERLGVAACDGAAVALARTQRVVATIATGARPAGGAVDAVVAWAASTGSTSYARGLARLLLVAAGSWRVEGDVLRARRAFREGRRLAVALDTAPELDLAAQQLVALYAATYPAAVVTLARLDLEDAVAAAGPPPVPMVLWTRLAQMATQVSNAAMSLQDPDAVAVGERLLREVDALAPDVEPRPPTEVAAPSPDDVVAWMRWMVRDAADEAPTHERVLRSRQLRDAGHEAEADALLEAAARAALARGPSARMTLAVVLASGGRLDAAREVINGMVAEGALEPDLAREAYLRVGDAADAASLTAAPVGDEPWREAAQRAEVLLGTGDPAAALTVAHDALGRADDELSLLARDALKSAATDDVVRSRLVDTTVRAHLALGGPDAVGASFAASDHGRVTVLADLMATPLDGAAGDALRAWHRAGSRWAATFEELAGTTSGVDAAEIRRRVAVAEDELDSAEDAVDSVAPGALAARRRAVEVGLTDVQEHLAHGTLALQYHVFDDELVVWAVTGTTASVHRVTLKRAGLVSLVRRWHDACRVSGTPAPERDALAVELAELVLHPVADDLATANRVLVVPHGPLGLVPFHLLPFGPGLLGDDHVLSFLPAASLVCRPRRPPASGGRALVVGDPAGTLPRLPAAAVEAAAVASRLATRPLVGADATEDAVVEGVAGADVLHLACHGLLDERAPNRNALVLAGGEPLTVGDLLGLRVDARLAVLSACDTGRGRSTMGGDVVGLTRALLAAGAEDVVVSLWPVDDRVACLTMVAFHEERLAGREVAAALHLARQTVRRWSAAEREGAYARLCAEVGAVAAAGGRREVDPELLTDPVEDDHPSLWAPFVHVGW